mmetsp:Transcript_20808/g.45849  ORF Transcript_20808/g.45849 Transcript_20808/m.45849 type:complete len:136 (-) Transcript_20808:270-677(-)
MLPRFSSGPQGSVNIRHDAALQYTYLPQPGATCWTSAAGCDVGIGSAYFLYIASAQFMAAWFPLFYVIFTGALAAAWSAWSAWPGNASWTRSPSFTGRDPSARRAHPTSADFAGQLLAATSSIRAALAINFRALF